MSLHTSVFVVALLAALAAPVAAHAEGTDPINVKVNMARILRISAPAATVIIGNPGVADVTIQDPQTLVLTGKSYGQTNLIVLDNAGNPVADTMISVIQAQNDLVTMFNGLARSTMVCAPVCQPMIMMGDDNAFTSNTLGSSNLVQSAAAPR